MFVYSVDNTKSSASFNDDNEDTWTTLKSLCQSRKWIVIIYIGHEHISFQEDSLNYDKMLNRKAGKFHVVVIW